jgi:hypothetical protein
VVLEECHFSVETEAMKKREWTEKTPNNVNMRRPARDTACKRRNQVHRVPGRKVAFLEYNKKHHIDNRETTLVKQKKHDNDHKGKREYETRSAMRLIRIK